MHGMLITSQLVVVYRRCDLQEKTFVVSGEESKDSVFIMLAFERSCLARWVFPVVLLDLLGIWITHEEFVVATDGQSKDGSVHGSHGESLKRRHTGVVSTDTRSRDAGDWARPV